MHSRSVVVPPNSFSYTAHIQLNLVCLAREGKDLTICDTNKNKYKTPPLVCFGLPPVVSYQTDDICSVRASCLSLVANTMTSVSVSSGLELPQRAPVLCNCKVCWVLFNVLCYRTVYSMKPSRPSPIPSPNKTP